MTNDYSDGSGIPKIVFWESLTGQKFKLGDSRVKKFYRTIGCVFNSTHFYANIQADDHVSHTIFDFGDDSLWKPMDSFHIKALPKVPFASIMPSTLDIIDEEKMLERALKKKVTGLRLSEAGLKTSYDKQLEYMLSPALANYEYERLASLTFAGDEFKSSVKTYVPEGHSFKAFPIQFNHFDVNKMVLSLLKNKIAYEIITARGDAIRHALRVKLVVYPENV